MPASPSSKNPRISVLIPAAGSGSRARTRGSKVLVAMGGVPLICHAAAVFREHPAVARILVIARREDFAELERAFADGGGWQKLGPLVAGGAERQDSVWNGLQALEAEPPEHVLIHDGARPFCSRALLDRVVGALKKNGAVVPTVPVVDTVRRIEEGKSEIVDRSTLYRCQTPQGFHWNLLWRAYRQARERGVRGTDDAQLVEALGEPVSFVAGEERNVKITTEADLEAARRLAGDGPWGAVEVL